MFTKIIIRLCYAFRFHNRFCRNERKSDYASEFHSKRKGWEGKPWFPQTSQVTVGHL